MELSDKLNGMVERNIILSQANEWAGKSSSYQRNPRTDLMSKAAVALYSVVLEQNLEGTPNLGMVYCWRSNAYFRLGEYRLSLKDSEKAAELLPASGDLYYNLSQVKLKLKLYPEALSYIDKAILLNPKDSLSYDLRGEICLWLKEYRRAIADYTRAIKPDPNNPHNFRSYNGRGISKHRLKNLCGADRDFTIALKLARDVKREDYSSIGSSLSNIYHNRASCRLDSGNYKCALADLRKVWKLKEETIDDYILRASVFEHCGEKDKAREDYKKALEILEATPPDKPDKSECLNLIVTSRCLTRLGYDCSSKTRNYEEMAKQFGIKITKKEIRGYERRLKPSPKKK